ncbi:MAG: class I tRNA ligase family protein, partial [Candidatus Poseidoniaceae archaeon]|nr:class I tRNA ligase family protein [Candidatus Poseidoniaceae archaeon]
ANHIEVEQRPPLDRWILSRLATVAKGYHDGFTNWNYHKACRELEEFVVNDLSNWYVRRSRRRLWDEAENTDKLSCQNTLHEVLTTVCRLVAPVSPFMVDVIYRNLVGSTVHLADWPLGTPGSIDGATADSWDEAAANATATLPPQDLNLEEKMNLVRELAETGRRIRIDASRRQRLPCGDGWIVSGPDLAEFHDILAEELNVENISIETDLDRFQQIELAPNFRALAPRARGDVNSIAAEIRNADDPATMLEQIKAGTLKIMGIQIEESDVEVKRVEKSGFAASTIQVGQGDDSYHVSLVLDMNDTPELLSKGLARDITRRIQAKRKDLNLEIEATIELEVWMVNAPELFKVDQDWIISETRANAAIFYPNGESPKSEIENFEVDDTKIYFKVS